MLAFYGVMFVAAAIGDRARWIRESGDRWRDAIARQGLQASLGLGRFGWKLHGQSSELDVWVTRVPAVGRETVTEVELVPKRWNGGAIAIAAGSEAMNGRGGHSTRVRTGDPKFDGVVSLSGPPDRLHAILDHATREAILWISRQAELTIAGGRLRIRFEEGALNAVPRKFFSTALEVIRRSNGMLDLVAELERSARHDPRPPVRAQCLQTLARGQFEAGRVRACLVAGCQDASPEVRLAAGRERREEGVETLLALVESQSVGDSLAREAVVALGRRLPDDRLLSSLRGALKGRKLETARACVDQIGRARVAGASGLLERILAVEEGELAAAASLALGATGGSNAQATLIATLERQDLAVAEAAATALGRCGSIEAVAPLRRAAQSAPESHSFRRSVERAIAAIHGRNPSAAPGQLSLAREAAGALSLPPASVGGLSLQENLGARGASPGTAVDSAALRAPR